MLSLAKKQLNEKGCAYLRVKAIPASAKTELRGVMADGTIKISVAAPADKGRANSELLKFLAENFGLPKNYLSLVCGACDRIKLVKIKTLK